MSPLPVQFHLEESPQEGRSHKTQTEMSFLEHRDLVQWINVV